MASDRLFLDHELIARPPYAPSSEEITLSKGSEVLVLDYNHTPTEALVEFNGVPWRVDREALEAFGIKRV